jgi:hypothetical protein
MKLNKLVLLIFASFIFMKQVSASSDSCGLRISLLTVTPGEELYSVFGHSALRVVDSVSGTDIIYNFGTFDFSDPDFYSKFVRGKLLYSLSQETFQNFRYENEYFHRGITEQVLSFNCQEKSLIQANLFVNMQEENRYYKYDFLKDNCTTRLRDIIFGANSKSANNKFLVSKTTSTYRDYLHFYLDRAEMPWTQLGIDVLLGLNSDALMNVTESMFLPDYLLKGVGIAKWGDKSLVSEEKILLKDLQPKPTPPPFWKTPMFLFSVIAIIFIVFFNSKFKKATLILAKLDFYLFLIIGIFGVILTFMWVGTDHLSFRYNINLIWAMPLNVIAAFLLVKGNKNINKYFLVYSLILLLLLITIFVFPGMINTSVFPIILLLSYRSWMIGRNDKKKLKQ